MNSCQLSFTLLQHTPLIHFQHKQAGATLRATEVKPKLDRFLIRTFGSKGIDFNANGWLMKGQGKSLNYQLQIKAPNKQQHITQLPMYFGNMGDDTKDKQGVLSREPIELKVKSFHQDLLQQITNHLPAFLATHNFGTRQTKGYGSFTIKDQAIDSNRFDYEVDQTFGTYAEAQKNLDLFYRAIRGGINEKKRVSGAPKDVFYFKSLLFLYFKQQNIQWEKKTIKKRFFFRDLQNRKTGEIISGLQTQERERNTDILTFNSNKKLLTKDLLGLSSEESWHTYNDAKLTKNHVPRGNEAKIERFNSPVLFKVLPEGQRFKIWIIFNDVSPMLDSKFDIRYRNDDYPIKTPKHFSLTDYFEFIRQVDILNHIEPKFRKLPQAQDLISMFQQLRPTT